MLMYRALALFSLFPALSPGVTVKTRACTGGVEAAKIRVDVRRPQGGDTRSLSRIKRIEKGSVILYKPVDLPADLKKDAKVALVLSSAESASSGLTIFEFQPAASPAEWKIPFRVDLAVFVLGPQGLDEKRVNTLVTKNDELISALADYADQTTEIEDTVDTLTSISEEDELDIEDAAARLDRGNPTSQALYTLLRALNNTVLANNPMGGGKSVGPVTLMNKASAGFFENAGGLFPGGGALSEIKPWLFPDTDFRAAFVQQSGESLSLCVPRVLNRSRNRQVYVWARRLLDAAPPSLALASSLRVPIGARSTVAIKATPASWQNAERMDRWSLTPAGGSAIPVRLRTVPGHNLEIDLRGFPGKPGSYRLDGEWDWDTVPVKGSLELAPLADLSQAALSPDSRSRLVENSGLAGVTLEGPDFEFVRRVSIRRVGATSEFARPVPFIIPQGPRSGPRNTMDLEIDTREVRQGAYLLAMQQPDTRSQEIPVQVLPNNVHIDNLPLRLPGGTAPLAITLRGRGLDKITRVEAERASIKLDPPGPDPATRTATISLDGAKKGDRIDLFFLQEGATEKRRLTAAIEVLGPAPVIKSVRTSVPKDLGVALNQGELPAGESTGFSVEIDSSAAVTGIPLSCGGVTTTTEFSVIGPGSLFFTVPGFGPPNCTLTAAIRNADGLTSEAVTLGRVIRLPRIESLTFTGEKNPDGTYPAILTGQDLEVIGKTSWDAGSGQQVSELPAPLAGRKQSLRVNMPWPSPSPKAPLYIWLRGESNARLTTTRY
ncbi:MAG: hypothetical protein IANPNBLG_01294 [Bryobacteraceae bacterium]|nr:hypothetical protein [Bryobacteraceae bacterium]